MRRLRKLARDVSLVTELELPAFEYTAADLRGEHFHATMAELRKRGWLAASEFGFVVLDREAVSFFLRSRSAMFPGAMIADAFEVEEGPLREEIRRNILHLDGEDHRRLRNLVNPAFSPRAADRWRPAMRRYLKRLYEPLAQTGSCDFLEAFARPYPSMMIATVMGAPLEDAGRLERWSHWIQRQFDARSMMEERHRIEQACAEFYEYAGALLDRRREEPRDDLLSALLAAEDGGDRLSDVECVNLVLNVLVGGVDTTQSQLAHTIRLLAEHPDQWALLAARPELGPRAVNEALRYEPIVPFTTRLVTEEVEYRGVIFPEGTALMVSLFDANRDLADGADPESFDITAEREPSKPLTFGAGIHNCLGASLARAELEEALAFLAPRMPELELDGEPSFGSVTGIYGLDALPIRFRPPSGESGR